MTNKTRRLDILLDHFISKSVYDEHLAYNKDDIADASPNKLRADLEELRRDPNVQDVDDKIFNDTLELNGVKEAITDVENYDPNVTKSEDITEQLTLAALILDDTSMWFTCLYLDFNEMKVVNTKHFMSKYHDYMAAWYRTKEEDDLPF